MLTGSPEVFIETIVEIVLPLFVIDPSNKASCVYMRLIQSPILSGKFNYVPSTVLRHMMESGLRADQCGPEINHVCLELLSNTS